MTASRCVQQWQVQPGGSVRGEVRVPGDKSISHRAVMFGALADGATVVRGVLEGADVLATIDAFRRLGVSIDGPDAGAITVHGVGRNGLQQADGPLDVGNSGTSMRLLAGLLCGLPFDVVLTGDDSLRRRPMGRVIEPLTAMGAHISAAEGGRAPLRLHGGRALRGIDYAMPVASAQVKSALLLAGLFAAGRTCVSEPAATRDHTERMLGGFGYPLHRDAATVCLDGGGSLTATAVDVPGDFSSATFLLVAASIASGSELLLRHVGWNATRNGAYEILRQMGADIEVGPISEVGGEPVTDLRVRAAALRGIEIPESLVALAIDEFPALFVAAACAEGETVLRGAEELRVKESDRIAVMAAGLSALGVTAEPSADGIRIVGRGGRSQQAVFTGGTIDSHGDHRIAMAFVVAALRADAPIVIDDCANVATSFPGFVATMRAVGLEIIE